MNGQKTPLEALEATIADFKAHPEMRISVWHARDADSRPVDPLDPSATCFCAIGRYAYHRGIPEDREVNACGARHDRRIEDDLDLLGAEDVWNANDADTSPTGEKIIPVLEGYRDRLKATLEA